jgi:chitinase
LNLNNLTNWTVFLGTLFASAIPQAAVAQQWSMGYWNGWSAPVSGIDWGAVTHVIHWSALVQPDGTLDVTTENVAASAPTVVAAGHAAGRKVLLSLMQPGWTGQTTNFQQAITGNNAALVSNIMKLVNTYGYDGIDIDWEPFSSSTNGAALTALASALRTQLGTKILTVAAITADYQYWGTAHTPFDRVNVMTYDLTGLWNPFSWHNAALYGSNQVWSIDLAVNRFENSGVPGTKLGIGIPFYGWKWTGGGITGPNQNWSSTPSLQQISYKDFASQINSQSYKWDSSAQVPYLSVNTGSPSSDQFLTYDNAQSIAAKVNYAKDHNLGGWIIWEMTADYVPAQTPSYPLLEAVKNAMATPTTGDTAPSITSSSVLPSAEAGLPYSATLSSSGSTGITWTLTQAALPAGLSLNASSGVISGTTSETGTYSFTVQASNVAGSDSQQFTLTVNPPPTAKNYYLSDLKWTSATIGWGAIHENLSVLGNALTLNGMAYKKGIGTHASSQIVFNIGDACTTFQSDVGIDDEVRHSGSVASVVFQVFSDGQKLYDSGLLTTTSPTHNVNVSLANRKQLVLNVTDGGDGITSDHADWANARLTCSSVPPAAK